MSHADLHAIVEDREPLVRMILQALIYELEILPDIPLKPEHRTRVVSELKEAVRILTEPR